jgi:hypothetical protein
MDGQDVVEVYSAANSVEAYAVANALEEAGIKAQVVGDVSEMWAGGLTLGHPPNPKVWVRKEDEVRARDIVIEWESEVENEHESEESESDIDTSTPEELAETTEELSGKTEDGSASASSGGNFVSLSPLLGVLGIASIIMGAFFSIENYRLLNQYPKTVHAKLVDSEHYFRSFSGEPMIPESWKTEKWKSYYIYEVDGVLHGVNTERANNPATKILIRYNPENPAQYHVGDIMHPAWCLVFGFAFGGFAFFLAYQFQ